MGKTLGQVAEGQLVKLNESGKPVEFYVAKQNYERGLNGAGLVLLVRKDVYQNGQWDSENINNYAESTILNWSGNTYRLLLDPWVYSSTGIVSTSIRVTNGSKVVETRRCLVFQLSLKELGLSNNDANIEGSTLPISSTLKIANYQGSPASQWTRTPNKYSNTNAFSVNSSGLPNNGNCTFSTGYRPCFCLKSNVYVADDGTLSEPIPVPKSITVPPNAMQGQPINVSWESASGVDSYILQRIKAGFWEQVYAGNDTEYTDTAGDWKNVQYRVCSVFNGANSDFRLSSVVKVVPTSALVISGQDGDLGTITNDIPYSINTDTGNSVTLVRTVNGVQVATATVQNGFSYNIPVMDLPTGTNTIVITATVTASSGQVTATRTWTYTKAAASFPTSGGVAALSQDGQPIFPQTLAEAVKAIGGPWGGNLSTALDKLARAAVFNREVTPKYTKVNVDLSTAKSGDIVNLPVKGVMVTHIVVQVGNPDPEMYDSSCDGVWLLRQDIVGNGQWNSTGVNTLSGSTIMTAMQGYVTDYDSTVQAVIQTVKIPYCVGNGSATVNTLANGLECKMFPLSAQEIGCGDYPGSGNVPEDGTKLDYFLAGYSDSSAEELRIAKYNGNNSSWSLRTPFNPSGKVWMVGPSGAFTLQSPNESCGYLTCFLLPTTFTATYYVDTAGNVYPSQEYTTAGDFYDLWGNVIPTVKIATGSYTGTGTTGESHPNELVVPEDAKIIFISPRVKKGGSWDTVMYPFIAIGLIDAGFMLSFSFTSNGSSNVLGNSYTTSYNLALNDYGLAELTKTGNSLKWWCGGNGQMNVSGTTYDYVILA